MKLKKKSQHNNRGFSLVELLVALAVSAVVITIVASFISQGTGFYSKQGNAVNLQNELQDVSNIVTDSLQEATYLEIINGGMNTNTVYTGKYSYQGGIMTFDSNKGNAKRIELEGSSLFVYDRASLNNITDTDKTGHRYSLYVDLFSVSVDSACRSGDDRYNQPLILDVSISVTNKGTVRRETKKVTLRNTIDELRIGDDIYMLAASGNQLIKVEEEE